MTSIEVEGLKTEIERVDDIPVIYGLLKRVGIQVVIDQAIRGHGNWQGLSPGWVITIWLLYILSEKNHLMEPVQSWTKTHMTLLRRLTSQPVEELDMTDDRLALCLFYLHKQATWVAIEKELGIRTIRIYGLSAERIRLDATVGTVYHDPSKHALFKVGKAKNGLYETQFKLMLASLDALGLSLVCDRAGESSRRSTRCTKLPAGQRDTRSRGRAGRRRQQDECAEDSGNDCGRQSSRLTPLANSKKRGRSWISCLPIGKVEKRKRHGSTCLKRCHPMVKCRTLNRPLPMGSRMNVNEASGLTAGRLHGRAVAGCTLL